MAKRTLSIGGKSYSIGSKSKSKSKPNPKAISYKKPSPKPSPKPKPKSISTITTQVQTSNTGRVNPNTILTNNPQVATQNNPQAKPTVKFVHMPTPKPSTPATKKVFESLKVIQAKLPPTLKTDVWSEKPITTFDPSEFKIDINATQNPNVSSEIQVHQDTRKIITTNGIKTTFNPTENELRILQAMEKQKAQEKLQGKSEWQINQDKLNAEKRRMEEAKQQTEQFRNRSDEEVLRNFIKVQTQKELAGDFGTPVNSEIPINPTNLNIFLTERGYDVMKWESIPTSVFKATKLDTAKKMREAGLSTRIINLRLDANNQVQNGTTIDTSVPLQKVVNYNGTGQISIVRPIRQPQPERSFVPMIQHQATKPVGSPSLPIKLTTPVDTKGTQGFSWDYAEQTAGIRTKANITKAIHTDLEADPQATMKMKTTLPLLAGLFLLGMG